MAASQRMESDNSTEQAPRKKRRNRAAVHRAEFLHSIQDFPNQRGILMRILPCDIKAATPKRHQTICIVFSNCEQVGHVRRIACLRSWMRGRSAEPAVLKGPWQDIFQ